MRIDDSFHCFELKQDHAIYNHIGKIFTYDFTMKIDADRFLLLDDQTLFFEENSECRLVDLFGETIPQIFVELEKSSQDFPGYT